MHEKTLGNQVVALDRNEVDRDPCDRLGSSGRGFEPGAMFDTLGCWRLSWLIGLVLGIAIAICPVGLSEPTTDFVVFEVASASQVRDIQQYDDEVWIAADSGLFWVHGDVQRRLLNFRVNAIARIKDSWWFGTEQGLYGLDGLTPERLYHQEIGPTFVSDIADSGAAVWVGTTRGLFEIRGREAQPTVIREPVNSIEISNGEVFICTQRNLYMKGLEGEVVPILDSAAHVRQLIHTSRSKWLLLSHGAVLAEKDGVWSRFVPNLERPPELTKVTAIAELRGEVFFGTQGGMRRIQGEKLGRTVFGPSVPVNSIVPFRDGVLLGTTRGLYWQRERDSEISFVDVYGGESDHRNLNVTGISIQGDWVWLASPDGAYRIDFRRALGRREDYAARGLVVLGGLVLAVLILLLIGARFFQNRSELNGI